MEMRTSPLLVLDHTIMAAIILTVGLYYIFWLDYHHTPKCLSVTKVWKFHNFHFISFLKNSRCCIRWKSTCMHVHIHTLRMIHFMKQISILIFLCKFFFNENCCRKQFYVLSYFTTSSGLNINFCLIVRYQWKLTSDK